MSVAKPYVALVDDEPELLGICQEFLSPFFEVNQFDTADHFLADIQRGYRPEVVVTDLRMPGKSGLDLAQSLLDVGLQCGVVLMSGFAERSDLITAIAANVSGFIEKPFDPIELIEKVKATARRQRSHLAIRDFLNQMTALNSEQAELNAAYFGRLAALEDSLFENFPEVFQDRSFKEKYIHFLRSTGTLTRKIASAEERIAGLLQSKEGVGRVLQVSVMEEGAIDHSTHENF